MIKKLGNMPWVQSLVSFIGYLIIMAVCLSQKFTVKGREYVEEMQQHEGGLILLWHHTLVLPIFSCRGMRLSPIIASSRDGELIARFAQRLGYDPVRGSTGKADGPAALMTCLRLIRKHRVIPITPDGPTGPLYTVHKGAIAILRKTGCPFSALGCAMKNPIVLKSWDSHRVPRPFDRSVVYYSPLVTLPPDITDEAAEELIREALHEADRKAEELLNVQ